MNNHKRCLQDVFAAIEENLEYITIDELVAISGYSYYHFHRIFKSHTGESVKKYIKRLQLERAVRKIKNENEKITDLAIEAGFHMSSSFNKAFKGMFAINPSQYKKSLEDIRKNYKEIEPLRVEELESFEVYAQRYVGECQHINTIFENMLEFAQHNSLIDEKFALYGITYDDPQVTNDQKHRYEVCVKDIKSIDIEGSQEVYKKRIEGGKFAVFLHRGDPNKLLDTYNSIYGRWLYENKIELRFVPAIQKILTIPKNEDEIYEDSFMIELYIPIE